MKDKYARERIDSIDREFRDKMWELRNKIEAIHRFLGVQEKSDPARTYLAKEKQTEC